MSLKKNSILLFLSRFVTQLSTFISISILSHSLAVEEYADYRQLVSAGFLIDGMLNLGMPTACLYFLSSKKPKLFLTNIYAVIFIPLALIWLGNTLFIDALGAIFGTDVFRLNSTVFLVISSLTVLISSTENAFIGLNGIKRVVVYSAMTNLIYLTAVVVVAVKGPTWNLVIGVHLVRLIIAAGFTLVVLVGRNFEFKQIEISSIREILKYSLPVYLSGVIGVVGSQFDKMLVSNLFDKRDYAIFANGAYEIPLVMLFGGALFGASISKLKDALTHDRQAGLHLWLKMGRLMIPFIMPVGSALIVFSEVFVYFIFSSKYSESSGVFAAYQSQFYSRIFLFGTFFVASNNTSIYLINSVLALSLSAALSVLLVRPMGLIGPAIAVSAANYCLVLLQVYQISRIVQCSFRDAFPWRDWATAILICLAVNIALYLLFIQYFSNMFVGLFLSAISVVTCFLILSNLIDDHLLLALKSTYSAAFSRFRRQP